VEVLLIILAVIGLLCLLLLAIAALSNSPPQPPAEDPTAPYREGLHAAVRLQRVAQDLEQQIYAEATRQTEIDPSDTQPGRRS
jgi:hypothetical protein